MKTKTVIIIGDSTNKPNDNRLKRALFLAELRDNYAKHGVSTKWVYENKVYPRFFISKTTFYKDLKIALAHQRAMGKNGGEK